MTMTDQFSADVQGVEPELPVNFVFNGKTYVGLRTTTPNSVAMADAGFIPKYDLELTVRLNQFAATTPAITPPTVRDTILIDAVAHRVESDEPDQASPPVVSIYRLVQQS